MRFLGDSKKRFGGCALAAMQASYSLSPWERAGVRAWAFMNRQTEDRQALPSP